MTMQKAISRRRFLKQATLAGGAAMLAGPVGAAKTPAHGAAGGPRPYRPSRAEIAASFRQQADYGEVTRQPVFKMRIEAHWFANGTHFWYCNTLAHGRREFILVDAFKGARARAFDHARLAAALSSASGHPHDGERLPFGAIEFTDDLQAVRFTADSVAWSCDLTSYACTRPPAVGAAPTVGAAPDMAPTPGADVGPPGASPDGRWSAFVRDNDLWVSARPGGTEARLTRDGAAARPYGEMAWSPDSQTLVAYRINAVPIKPVYLIESSPRDGSTRAVPHQHEYAQPGDPLPSHEMWLFDPAAGTGRAAQVEAIDYDGPPELRWDHGGRRLTFQQMDRGYQRFRVFAVDAKTGASRSLIDDREETFVDSTNLYVHFTDDGREILHASEGDGWRHLYLHDGETGALKNQVTRGAWVVRRVERVDEAARQVWFTASGRNQGQDPYLVHQYRVNFDGTGLVALTEGDGTHELQFSPDRRFIVDTYSRADQPPVHELRRASDGALVCPLETADISALMTRGWRPPEVFRAKGRDGITDIWGLVFRPLHMDPALKYPVIENIYAGPTDSFTRKSFAVQDSMQSLAELGFVVVQCDGMGTRNRSKAFHNVCWHDLKDAGLPDRIAWIKALAAYHPWVDAGRVGIYGTSAGGQSSTGALLFHPEFYHVGVSSCGCHDNRIDKLWWNEQWMGHPVGPHYADSSNITHAAGLRGKLLLLVGELDTNVPPESTVRLSDALMKAGKDFDFVIITGSDHTSGGPYGERRRRDYFVRHLLGAEPPDRNAPAPPPPPPILLTPRPLAEAAQASGIGGDETSVLFRNLTNAEIHLFWLPGDGTQKPYGSLAPGATRDMHTFAGHWWLVVREGGQPLALFVGEARAGIAEIR